MRKSTISYYFYGHSSYVRHYQRVICTIRRYTVNQFPLINVDIAMSSTTLIFDGWNTTHIFMEMIGGWCKWHCYTNIRLTTDYP